MDIGERIKEIRKAKGLTQKDIATKLGITIGAYSHYEKGTREMNVATIKALSKILGISGDELIDTGFQNPVPEGVIKISDINWKKVPLWGSMAAGEPITDAEFPGTYCNAPTDADFALHVKGDSMVPTYYDGDIVFIRQTPDLPYNGAVVVICIDNDAAIKHVAHAPEGVIISSDNPAYPAKVIKAAEHEVRILGIPVGFLRMFRRA